MNKYFIGIFVIVAVAIFWLTPEPPEATAPTVKIAKPSIFGEAVNEVRAQMKDTANVVPHTAPSNLQSNELDHRLQVFVKVASKALPSSEELASLRRHLADPKWLDATADLLTAQNEKVFENRSEDRRMAAVHFLADAIEWDENPNKAHAIQKIEEVIRSFRKQPTLPDRLRRSYFVDRLELYMTLMIYAGASAESLKAEARGQDWEGLITMAETKLKEKGI